MANVQHIEVHAGENRTLALSARGPANLPANLTGKTVTWYVGRSPFYPFSNHALITAAGVVVSASAGTFTVAVVPSDTLCFEGDYQHYAQTTDGSGNVESVCGGRFRVLPVLVP